MLPNYLRYHGEGNIPLSIVSNSSLLREGLVGLLPDLLPVEFVGLYNESCLFNSDMPSNPNNHVVIVDGNFDKASRLACIRYWRKDVCNAKVLVFELENEIDAILDCIEAGASGYILRGAPIYDLAHSIELTSRGLAQCPPHVTAQLFARLEKNRNRNRSTSGDPGQQMPLTPRELEVLEQIAKLRSNREIAHELVIAVHTVKHHVHSILTKLELSHRHAAAKHAIERGWIEKSNTL